MAIIYDFKTGKAQVAEVPFEEKVRALVKNDPEAAVKQILAYANNDFAIRGFLQSMYTFLKSNPVATAKEIAESIERFFQGNSEESGDTAAE